MRRRAAAVLLCLVLAGCGKPAEDPPNPTEHYSLYFLERDLRDVPGAGALQAVDSGLAVSPDPQAAAETLIEALLAGPQEERLQSAIPPGTTLRSLELQGSRADVDLSGEYAALTGVALTLADYAVTLTLTQIPEISRVRVTVRGQELAYRDRQSFTPRDVFLYPEGDVVGEVDVLLYFPDAAGELREEPRTLSLYEGDTQVEAVLEAVAEGPGNRDLFPAFPEGFRIRSAWQEDDICLVNLSSALLDILPEDAAVSRALLSLDRSLCSLDTLRAVRYLVDGEYVEQYGQVRLAEPYEVIEEGA